MTSHHDVAKAFANGQQLKGTNMFTDGTSIWSYGLHFCIAHKLGNGVTLFNTDHYSVSTSKHQSYVRGMMSNGIECTTSEIKEAMRTGVAIINRHIEPTEITTELEHLKEAMKHQTGKKKHFDVIKKLAKGELEEVPPLKWSDFKLGKKIDSIVLPKGRYTLSICQHEEGYEFKYLKRTFRLPYDEVRNIIRMLHSIITPELILKNKFELFLRYLDTEPKYKEVLLRILGDGLTDEDKEKLEKDIKMREII